MCYSEKEAICTVYILYDSNSMTFWKRENHGDSNASLDARDKMWGERYGQGQRILQAGQLLLCMGLSRRWTHVSIQQSEPTESVKPSVKWHVG